MTDHRRIAGFRKLQLLCLPLVLGCGVSLTDGLSQTGQRESAPRVVLTGSSSARPSSAVSPPTISSSAKASAVDQLAQRDELEHGSRGGVLPPGIDWRGLRQETMQTPPTDRSADGEIDSSDPPSPEIVSVNESELSGRNPDQAQPIDAYELAGKLDDVVSSAVESAATSRADDEFAESATPANEDDVAGSAPATADTDLPASGSTFVPTRSLPSQASSGPVAVLTVPAGGDDQIPSNHSVAGTETSNAATPSDVVAENRGGEESAPGASSFLPASETHSATSDIAAENSNTNVQREAPVAAPSLAAPADAITAESNQAQPPVAETERLPAAPAVNAAPPTSDPRTMVANTATLPVSSAIGPIPLPRQIAPPVPGRFMPAEATRARRSEMLAVARLADAHTRQAFDLAGRNALFTARTEFIAALSMVAQGLDSIERSNAHLEAMHDGLRALAESDDFISTASQIDTGMDAVTLSRPHKTPVLKGLAPGSVSIMEALQSYYGFAQQQFVFAADHEPAASAALHGLGKLHTVLGRAKAPHAVAAEPKGIVFQQAALLVDPRNFMASNELGVLLSNYGKYQQAKAALLQSVTVSGQPITWRNLAAVHSQLGETRLAQLALREAEIGTKRGVERAQVGPSGVPIAAFDIRWVDKDTLARVRESTPSAVKQVPSVVTAPPSPTIQTSASQKR